MMIRVGSTDVGFFPGVSIELNGMTYKPARGKTLFIAYARWEWKNGGVCVPIKGKPISPPRIAEYKYYDVPTRSKGPYV